MTTPNQMLSDSLAGVLDAFAAAYDLRTDAATGRDPYYFGNLPPECRPASARGELHDVPTAETVRQTVAETRRRLGDSNKPFFPLLVGRNLRVLLPPEPRIRLRRPAAPCRVLPPEVQNCSEIPPLLRFLAGYQLPR